MEGAAHHHVFILWATAATKEFSLWVQRKGIAAQAGIPLLLHESNSRYKNTGLPIVDALKTESSFCFSVWHFTKTYVCFFSFFLSCTCHFASAYTSKGQMFSFWSYYSPSRKTNCQDSGCKQLWAHCCAVISAGFQRECKKFKRQLINMPTKPRRNCVMNIHIVPETRYFERTCSGIRRRIHEHLLLK